TEHVGSLTARLIGDLRDLRHSGGAPLTRVYGPEGFNDRGGTVAFNVLDRTGKAIPYPMVEARARDAGVALRGGCFCNPGAAEAAFGFDAMRVARCLESMETGFAVEHLSTCLGADTAVGAVRA